MSLGSGTVRYKTKKGRRKGWTRARGTAKYFGPFGVDQMKKRVSMASKTAAYCTALGKATGQTQMAYAEVGR